MDNGLSPERWKQIDDIFAAALERPPSERDAFVEAACGGDAQLLAEVRSLLEAEAEAESALGESVDHFAAPLISRLHAEEEAAERDFMPPGTRVGPYRIVEEIGRGGMGAVYRAERADGEFEQTVAIKVVKRGMDTDEVLRRFRRERQILASLQHPNIAALLDGGATGDGRPYLVMEYVDGEPIDLYCDRRRFDIRERLTLFRTVCQAVEYAHRHLVVHRDLKPSNILVAADGTVKLLDFGIAKLVNEDTDGELAATRTGLRLLTPDFASPEQVLGLPVTTASDVYALGTVLYALLCGRRAFALSGLTLSEAERVVLDEDALPPSTVIGRALRGRAGDDAVDPERAAEIAHARATTPQLLRRRLAGDLDTITLTALAKAPERRYGSPAHLADDIDRYLSGRPVLARPDGFVYRASKFVRRHRAGVAAAVVVCLSLFSGLGAALWQARRAQQERDVALQVSSFLEELFQAPDPYADSGERLDTLRVRALVDRGAARLRDELASQPAVQARMLAVLGGVYSNLALHDEAEAHLTESLRIRTHLHGTDHVDVAEVQHRLATVLRDRGELARADTLYRAAIATRRSRLGADHPAHTESLTGLGEMLRLASRYAEADSVLREATRIQRLRAGDPTPALVATLNTHANLLQSRGEYVEAERVRREALSVGRQVHGDRHPQVAVSLGNLATLLVELERPGEAEPLLREALDTYRETVGDEHPHALSALNSLALALNDREAYDDAENTAREALELRRRVHGDRHHGVFTALNTLAIILTNRQKLDEAETVYREQLELSRQIHPGDHTQTVIVLNNLGSLLRGRGRYDEAESLQRETLDMGLRILRDTHPAIATFRTNLAMTLQARNRTPEAEPLLRQALSTLEGALPPHHPRITRARIRLGECLTQLGRFEEAESLLQIAFDQTDDDSPDGAPLRNDARSALHALYTAWDRPEQAAAHTPPGP